MNYFMEDITKRKIHVDHKAVTWSNHFKLQKVHFLHNEVSELSFLHLRPHFWLAINPICARTL